MMLWEHVVVGYIGYSLFVHFVSDEAPTGREALVVALGASFPDLVDKPLGWGLGVFPTGYGLAHSIFVVLTVSAVVVVALRRSRPRLGWSFAIGYLLHPPADVLAASVFGGRLSLDRILWPVHLAQQPHRQSIVDGFVSNVTVYLDLIRHPLSPSYVVAINSLMVLGVALWIYDGMPVVR